MLQFYVWISFKSFIYSLEKYIQCDYEIGKKYDVLKEREQVRM